MLYINLKLPFLFPFGGAIVDALCWCAQLFSKNWKSFFCNFYFFHSGPRATIKIRGKWCCLLNKYFHKCYICLYNSQSRIEKKIRIFCCSRRKQNLSVAEKLSGTQPMCLDVIAHTTLFLVSQKLLLWNLIIFLMEITYIAHLKMIE